MLKAQLHRSNFGAKTVRKMLSDFNTRKRQWVSSGVPYSINWIDSFHVELMSEVVRDQELAERKQRATKPLHTTKRLGSAVEMCSHYDY